MSLAPILLFVYNRPRHTERSIVALQKNDLAVQSDLIIFSDGPKDVQSEKMVLEVRHYLKSIVGFKTVKIIEREENWGLSKSIVDGVSRIINESGKVIVLEDDLITSPFFLKYMNEALVEYENEKDVVSIHGYVYPVKDRLPETFFIKGADCWGWATWKRGWNLYQDDSEKLLNELILQKLTKEFDFKGSYPYIQMLKSQNLGFINSWAIKWYASAFLENKLTLYPGRSLVVNSGLDDSGSHTGSTSLFDVKISETPIEFKKIPVCENSDAKNKIIAFFKLPKLRLFLAEVKIKFYLKLVINYVKKIG